MEELEEGESYLIHCDVLFQELMGKVIEDMPEEPITYLIRALNRKAARSGVNLGKLVIFPQV